MTIQTERLELRLLTVRELRLLCSDIKKLEDELACKYEAEPLEGFFIEIIKNQTAIAEKDPENTVWHSFFLIIRKSDRTVVGSSDFKDVPDKNGETEIGYGLGKAFEHNGYMSETVQAMSGWAFSQSSVKAVIAETERDNLPSQRVLARCGFEKYSDGETLWWRLKRPVNPE